MSYRFVKVLAEAARLMDLRDQGIITEEERAFAVGRLARDNDLEHARENMAKSIHDGSELVKGSA